MADTNFTSGTTIVSPWLNDVNDLTYHKTFPDGTTALVVGPGGTIDAIDVSYEPQGVGAVSTTVAAKLYETVSVKDFGAVGDGVTDDTDAIKAAVTTAGSVYFPSGTYLCGDVIGDVPCDLIGESWITTTIEYTGTSADFIVFTGHT